MKQIKRLISTLLMVALLASTVSVAALADVQYPSVTVTFVADPDIIELKYRAAMATIINEYYKGYCKGQSEGLKEYYGIPWPFSSRGQEYFNQFSGIYRTYYFASLSFNDFGYEGKRGTYNAIMYDGENKAEWDAQRKHYYMYLIAETMEETVKINKNLNEDIDVSKIGMYVIDPATGGLKYDEKGVMGDLEAIQDNEVAKAATDFAMDLVQLGFDGFDAYMKVKSPEGTKDPKASFAKFIKQLFGGITEAAKDIVGALTDNNIKRLNNDMLGIQRKYIANSILRARADVIQYLNDIYMGKNAEYINVATDPNFIAAVKEYLAEYKKAIGSAESVEDVVNDLTLAEDSVQDEKVLDNEELTHVIVGIVCNQALDVMLQRFKEKAEKELTGLDEDSKRNIEKLLIVPLIDSTRKVLTQYFESCIDATIKDEPLEFDVDKLPRDIVNEFIDSWGKRFEEVLESDLSKLEKEEQRDRRFLSICIQLVVLAADEAFDTVDGKWEDEKSKEFTLLINEFLDIFIEDLIWDFAQKATLPTDKMEKIKAEVKEYWDIGTELVEGVYDTAYSLALTMEAIYEDGADEKQVSQQALMMYLTYQASYPLEKDICMNIIMPKLKKNPGMDLYDIVMDEDKFTHEEIDKCVSRIMMQVNLDLTGMKHLITVINITDQKWNTRYFNYMRGQMRECGDKRWEYQFMIDSLTNSQNLMDKYHDRWESIKKSVSTAKEG